MPTDYRLVGGKSCSDECPQENGMDDYNYSPASTTSFNQPLDVNTLVKCVWRGDGKSRKARIIERRKIGDTEGPESYDYYVHYIDFNRRMDEWVGIDQLDLSTVEIDSGDSGEAAGRTRNQKRKLEESTCLEGEGHGNFDPHQLREHEEFTKVKNVETIELGQFAMDTWYFSPLPEEYRDCKKLYFCEISLQFFRRRSSMLRHLKKLKVRHPPGDEIYRKGKVSMFEVDGRKHRIYCQNLCYLAKMFLDHKTLYYDVDLFLFYVLCELDERGSHIVGYFSKEKHSEEGYNLACILTLPSYQRKGYGKFLISMSYELSKIEGKVGTPERPLSDLGLISYRACWTRVLLNVLKDHEGSISIKELSDITAIKTDDIISTLRGLNMIQYKKGQHVICAAKSLVEKHLSEAGSPGLEVESRLIVWTPYDAQHEYVNYRA
ncbi:hypothetical protein BSKO_03285 [Bryopsis sp. KO-2023]|nr:hypothetical protein BSKO_03285 [Bryopsis sp. KO-2023]